MFMCGGVCHIHQGKVREMWHTACSPASAKSAKCGTLPALLRLHAERKRERERQRDRESTDKLRHFFSSDHLEHLEHLAHPEHLCLPHSLFLRASFNVN
jgi:hypothetical protein